jgi:hypothetical protein
MPQWFKSVCVSRQTPVQLVVPPPHESWHAPIEQS